jgi:sulfur dioxygenase
VIFRQLFDHNSSTYTYLLGSRAGGEALLIDPVLEHVDEYVELVTQLDLRLVLALDTHVHADHITALGSLRDRVGCPTMMGERSKANCVSVRVRDNETLDIDGVKLTGFFTPGHTDDSFSFVMRDRVFTGDTLLIRGTGRTDFQNGDPYAAYDSLFNRLLKLPNETLVYPAHDYKGQTVSTIAEERRWNPRLQVGCADEYAAIMRALHLPDPKLMDIAVTANLACGKLPV